jgi:16S rRNA U1498 N3-methylase RsmE
MIKIYLKNNRLEDENGLTIQIHPETVRVAKTGKVTKHLRRVLKAAWGEKVIIFNANSEVTREAIAIRK